MSSSIVSFGKTRRFSERLIAQRFKTVILKRNALQTTILEANEALGKGEIRLNTARRIVRIASNKRNALYREQMLAFKMARKVLTEEALEAIIVLDEE
jgi:hypothetical protein